MKSPKNCLTQQETEENLEKRERKTKNEKKSLTH